MNRFPLRLKITLWFSTVLIILVALTCGVILYINDFMIHVRPDRLPAFAAADGAGAGSRD